MKQQRHDCFDCKHCHCGGYQCYFCDLAEHEDEVHNGYQCEDYEEE